MPEANRQSEAIFTKYKTLANTLLKERKSK